MRGAGGVALAPALTIGASGEHAAFPGTLSIGAEALTTCLVELGRHASLHWPALLLVNGHGGNVGAVQAAAGRLRYEGRAAFAWHAAMPDGDAHAGRAETSVMLALDPDPVAWTPRAVVTSGRSMRSCRCCAIEACARSAERRARRPIRRIRRRR